MSVCIVVWCFLGIFILGIVVTTAVCCWIIGSIQWWTICSITFLLSVAVICCTYLQALKIKQSVNLNSESERSYRLAQLIITEKIKKQESGILIKDVIGKERTRLISFLNGMKGEIKDEIRNEIRDAVYKAFDDTVKKYGLTKK